MTPPREEPRRPSPALGVAIFLATTLGMAYLRLVVFHDRVLSLGSALPLAICLWYRDRRLLWSMVAAQSLISILKAVQLNDVHHTPAESLLQGVFQLTNIAVMAVAMLGILRVTERLRDGNAELRNLNDELAAREEEIGRQNEELRAQNEEIQRQHEEANVQAEELQRLNLELSHREKLLEALVQSFPSSGDERLLLEKICRSVLDLFEGSASAAAIVEREGGEIVARAGAGSLEGGVSRWPLEGSFAAIVMEQGRTAFVEDLRTRPDLRVTGSTSGRYRSVLASPLRNGEGGAVKVFSEEPRQWTTEHFRILEWVAAQSSVVLEARRLRSALESSKAGLEKVVAERTAELLALVDELRHFSYTITHDMRAPLRAMRGFAELLVERAAASLDEESRDYLNRIGTSAVRMDRLITDALSYASAMREHMALAPVDPAALLKGIIESYPPFQPPKARIEIEDGLPRVLGNEAGLTQCFSNLIGNAVKFVEPGKVPVVRVRGERRGPRARLWIEDNGIGIPPEMLPRMFGMFQRASKDYEGTGIGLALVRKVVEHMGGEVGVERGPDGGSRFWIELQAADA